jgi:hypothetical protein
MMTIYKYPFEIINRFTLALPRRAQFLHAGFHDGVPCLWALVNPDNPPDVHHFRIYGTGHAIEEDVALDGKHLATFSQGYFVWHLFETRKPSPYGQDDPPPRRTQS